MNSKIMVKLTELSEVEYFNNWARLVNKLNFCREKKIYNFHLFFLVLLLTFKFFFNFPKSANEYIDPSGNLFYDIFCSPYFYINF